MVEIPGEWEPGKCWSVLPALPHFCTVEVSSPCHSSLSLPCNTCLECRWKRVFFFRRWNCGTKLYGSRYLTLRCVQTWGDKFPEDYNMFFVGDNDGVSICANFPPGICTVPLFSTGRGNGHSPPSWFSMPFMILWTSLVFFLSCPFPGWGKLLHLGFPIWSCSVPVLVFIFARFVSFSLGNVDPNCIPRGWRWYKEIQDGCSRDLHSGCVCAGQHPCLNRHIHGSATELVSATENSKFD